MNDDGFAGEPPREEPPRSRLAEPVVRPSFLVGYGLVVASGAALAVYVVFWLNAWIGAVFGALAAICAFLPFFAYREYMDELRLVNHANERMQSHTVATKGYLQIQLDRSNTQWMREMSDVLVERDAALAKIQLLEAKIPARDDKTGRFAKRSKPVMIEGSASNTPPVITLSSILEGTIEG